MRDILHNLFIENPYAKYLACGKLREEEAPIPQPLLKFPNETDPLEEGIGLFVDRMFERALTVRHSSSA